MSEIDRSGLSTAERLAIASAIAPILRSVPDRVTKRRVKVYSRETGETLRETVFGDGLRGLAEMYALEHAVDDAEAKVVAKRGGVKRTSCLQCGLEFEYPKSVRCKPAACEHCTALPCDGGCEAPTPRYAMGAAYIRTRKGRRWTCRKCASQRTHQRPEYRAKMREVGRRLSNDPVFRAKLLEAAKDPERMEKIRRSATTPERIAKASKEQRHRHSTPEARARQAENGRKGAAKRWSQEATTNGKADG